MKESIFPAFRALWQVMVREYYRYLGNRTYLFVTLIGPLLSFALIIWIFYQGVPRELPVALVDLDQTPLSRKIARMADATPIARLSAKFTSTDEAFSAMKKGLADAVFIIPEGCERQVMLGEQVSVILCLNNANVLKGGLITSGLSKSVMTLSAGIRIMTKTKQGQSWEQATAQAMPVMTGTHILFNPFVNYSYFLVSSLLPVMLIVFVLMGCTYATGSELKQGSGPDWLKTANGNILIALFGKLIPYTALYFMMALVMNHFLFSYMGVPLHGHLHILLVSQLLLILGYQFLSVFLTGLTANLRLSLSLAGAYTMMALTFSGLTYPLQAMPALARAFAGIFPFTYYLETFIGQALRNEPSGNALSPMLGLWAFIFLGMTMVPRMKYILSNHEYWGKI